MSNQEVTRWQHDGMYLQPANTTKSHFKYTNDLIFYIPISIYMI